MVQVNVTGATIQAALAPWRVWNQMLLLGVCLMLTASCGIDALQVRVVHMI